MPVGTFLREAYLLPAALCTPLLAGLLWLRHWYVARNYLQLAGQLLMAGAVYGAVLLWAYRAGNLWKTKLFPPVAASEQQSASTMNATGYGEL